MRTGSCGIVPSWHKHRCNGTGRANPIPLNRNIDESTRGILPIHSPAKDITQSRNRTRRAEHISCRNPADRITDSSSGICSQLIDW